MFQGAPGSADADPMAAIRAKMAQDPNYDPMKDPEAMQTLEQMIPPEMREIPNSVERLKVAFTDATSGPDSKTLSELESIAASFDTKELIQSPNSEWFKNGMPDGEATDEAKLQSLYDELKAANPDVPEA